MVHSMLTLCAGLALMTEPQSAAASPPGQKAAQAQTQAQSQVRVNAQPQAQAPANIRATVKPASRPVVKTVAYFPVELEVVHKTNAERARHGLAPLELDPNLVHTARKHTWWMTRNHSLQHGNYPVAENIAMGQQSSGEVVHCWMNSSGHRANILNRGHRRIGVAAYTTPSGTTYWCQQFTR